MAQEALAPAPTGPVIYDASSESVNLKSSWKKPDKVLRDEFDVLRAFSEDPFQLQTDIRQWLTTTAPAARAQRLLQMEEDFAVGLYRATLGSTNEEIVEKVAKIRDSRWRTYSAIVWQEGRPGMKGSADIAQKAAEMLFWKLEAKTPGPRPLPMGALPPLQTKSLYVAPVDPNAPPPVIEAVDKRTPGKK